MYSRATINLQHEKVFYFNPAVFLKSNNTIIKINPKKYLRWDLKEYFSIFSKNTLLFNNIILRSTLRKPYK
jgi:hypothetical protein